MSTFNESAYALLQEVLRTSPSSRAIRKLSQESGEYLKKLSTVGNAHLNRLLEGSKFPVTIGMSYYIASALRTVQKDGNAAAAFSVAAAIQSIDQMIIDTGNGEGERAIVGNPLISMEDAVYAIEVIDSLDRAKRVVILHKILNIMSEMYFAASQQLKDSKDESVQQLLSVVNAVMSSNEFNIAGAWMNMTSYVQKDEPIESDLQQYFKTFLSIFNSLYELDACPKKFKEYLYSLRNQGITFREGSFTMGSINIDTSPIEEVK